MNVLREKSRYFRNLQKVSNGFAVTTAVSYTHLGLAYFETEALGYYPAGIANLLDWSYKEEPVISFSTYTKLQSLRMFKNGRVDIKFKSKDYASRFVSEFLGLVC